MKSDFSPKMLVLIAVSSFCVCELLDWTGIFGKRFPRGLGEALVQAFINILWVALFMGILLFRSSRRSQ